tara:strand:+ start:302 stop:1123 length:822 start_codon:yes stop_codon:yes gene_type:complete
MVIHKTRKNYKHKRRRRRKTKKYTGGKTEKDKKDKKDKKEPLSVTLAKSIKRNIQEKKHKGLKEQWKEWGDAVIDEAKSGKILNPVAFIHMVLGMLVLSAKSVVKMPIAMIKLIKNAIKKIGPTGPEQMKPEEMEEKFKKIQEDVKKGMKEEELKKKYLPPKMKLGDSTEEQNKRKRIGMWSEREFLKSYIKHLLKTSIAGENDKIENKSGPLYYKVSINKDGFLKFNTHGKPQRPAPDYTISNLFTRGNFTRWGGKKRKTRKRKRRKRKRRK